MKKSIHLFVCLLLTALILFSGCTKEEQNKATTEEYWPEIQYKQEKVEYFENAANTDIWQLYGDSIYFSQYQQEDGKSKTIVRKMNPQDMTVSEEAIVLPEYVMEFNAYQATVMNEHHFISVCNEGAGTANIRLLLQITDRQGEVLYTFPLTDLLENLNPNQYRVYLEADEEYIYLAYHQQMTVLDMQGKRVTEYALAGQVMQLQTDRYGRLYVLEQINGSVALEFLDSPAGELTLAEEHNDAIRMINPQSVVCGEENLLYFNNANGLIRYNLLDGSYGEIINWGKENFLGEQSSCLVVVSDALIYLYGSGERYAGGNVYRYIPMTEEEIAQIPEDERIVIKVTHSESGWNTVEQAALKFNAAQNVYRVVCEAIPYPTGEELLNDYDRKLLTGELGDVVIMSGTMDFSRYAEKGAFVNLYALMEEDETFSAEDIFPCVREILESPDGGLYVIAQEFYPQTLVGKAENLPDGLWNLDAMLALEDSLPEGKQLMTGMSRYAALRCLLSAGADEFIDYERAECSFESETFLQLMEYLKSLPESVEWVGIQQDNAPYRNDEILLCETSMKCFFDYHILRAGFGFDSELQIVGYPSAVGGVANIGLERLAGISASSEQQAGAWEFVKFLLSGEAIYNEVMGMRFIPSWKKALPGWKETEGQLYYYFAEGTTDYRLSLGPFQDESKIDYPGRLVTLDDETLAKFTAFVESIHAAPGLPEDIYTIIQEEMSGYFAGAKSAAETAKVIQNRVGTYLSEQS